MSNPRIVNQAAADQSNAINKQMIDALAVDDYGRARALEPQRDAFLAEAYGVTVAELPAIRTAQAQAYRAAFSRR